MPCKNELEREARVILQVMMRNKHVIKQLPFDEVALYVHKNGHMSFVKKISLVLVEYMHQNKWLKLDGGQYSDTKMGRVWLSEFIYFLDLSKPHREASTHKFEGNSAARYSRQADLSMSEKSIKALGDNDDEFSPILKLYNRQRNITHKYLTHIHLQAGQKIFDYFVAANLQPSITMDWQKLQSVPQQHYRGQGNLGHAEKAHIASGLLYRSLEAVGQEYAAILVEICIFGNGLEATERAMNWPARSGKLLLTMALDKLAEHYKIIAANPNENKYLAWAKQAVDANLSHKT